MLCDQESQVGSGLPINRNRPTFGNFYTDVSLHLDLNQSNLHIESKYYLLLLIYNFNLFKIHICMILMVMNGIFYLLLIDDYYQSFCLRYNASQNYLQYTYAALAAESV